MDRRMRTNLILAAIVAVLGLVIWFVPQAEKPTGFAPVDTANISSITVSENGETRLRLERVDEAWRVVKPFVLPADRFQVDALLASLGERAEQRYPVEDAKLAELGLESPAWTMQVDDVTLNLGGRAAIGNRRYVQASGHIYLLNDVLSYRIKRPALDYASRRLLPEDMQLSAIRLPSGEHIERSNGGWTLTPENSEVSADALQLLADAWQNATAMNVEPANSVPRDGEAVLTFADGGELLFGVERTSTGLRLTRDAPAITYTLPASEAEALLEIDAGSPPTESE